MGKKQADERTITASVGAGVGAKNGAAVGALDTISISLTLPASQFVCPGKSTKRPAWTPILTSTTFVTTPMDWWVTIFPQPTIGVCTEAFTRTLSPTANL